MSEKNTWDKRDSETNKSYNAFLVYKDLGVVRTLPKASIKFYGMDTDGKRHQFLRWSSAHSWVSRCADWDLEEERLRVEQKRKDIRDMDRRQAKDGMRLSKIGMKNIELQAADDLPLDKNGNPIQPKIPVTESTKLFTEGVKAERIARGEAAEISEHKGGIKIIFEDVEPDEDN